MEAGGAGDGDRAASVAAAHGSEAADEVSSDCDSDESDEPIMTSEGRDLQHDTGTAESELTG